jgi:hypothetical protein
MIVRIVSRRPERIAALERDPPDLPAAPSRPQNEQKSRIPTFNRKSFAAKSLETPPSPSSRLFRERFFLLRDLFTRNDRFCLFYRLMETMDHRFSPKMTLLFSFPPPPTECPSA